MSSTSRGVAAGPRLRRPAYPGSRRTPDDEPHYRQQAWSQTGAEASEELEDEDDTAGLFGGTDGRAQTRPGHDPADRLRPAPPALDRRLLAAGTSRGRRRGGEGAAAAFDRFLAAGPARLRGRAAEPARLRQRRPAGAVGSYRDRPRRGNGPRRP